MGPRHVPGARLVARSCSTGTSGTPANMRTTCASTKRLASDHSSSPTRRRTSRDLFEPGHEVVIAYGAADDLVAQTCRLFAADEEARANDSSGRPGPDAARSHLCGPDARACRDPRGAPPSEPRREAGAHHGRPRFHRLQPRAPSWSSSAPTSSWSIRSCRSTAGCCYNIAGIEDRVTVNISDVRDEHSLRYLVRGQDYLFNLAGQTSHLDSMTDPYTDLEINARSQLSILEACRHENPDGEGRVREHTPDLRPTAAPAGRRGAPDRARRRERHQQDGWRVVSPALRRRVRPAHRAYSASRTPTARACACGTRARRFSAIWLRRALQGERDARVRRRQPAARPHVRRRCGRRIPLAAASDEANGSVYNLGGPSADLVARARRGRRRGRRTRHGQDDPVPGGPQEHRHRRLLCGLVGDRDATSAGSRRWTSSRTASSGPLAYYREHGSHYWDGE